MSVSRDQSDDREPSKPLLWGQQLLGAVTFYTQIPIPHHWLMRFEGIARFAPWVGIGIGMGLATIDWGLATLALPLATRCALLVALWLWVTGGLHLDGAMDTADGLAVPDPARRLDVMADSRAGAFGVMVAIVLLGLKTVCLMDLETGRWVAFALAAGWGRWGQVVAIARYPYLRETGKGALHKIHAHPTTDWLWGLVALLGISGLAGAIAPEIGLWLLEVTLCGGVIALAMGAWLQGQLGGHTGDTYGAIVEWTEVLVLGVMVGLQGWV
ncbi:adenosylcobinamide-GDP ribazoletransferase [Leptolyngbya iicbica]|uniref:Adenosylcobinamide-GDP ribazoletransferase n=2 Tax=Cyanophyceae TaxID=3028117 RepID=A0A4Q7E430_9CYAN|nr:adenosylcobinamide-GDP ribazoletransferase [Leptolyngbya sp. LK]RZM76588.1 adenosylcobinamide-GDP ribazoletransferase [Leptolyngbya sp. LK]